MLATLLAALPAAQAEAPEARAWSPHELKAPITGLALADDGLTLAATTEAPEEEATGTLQGTGFQSPTADSLVVFSHTTGHRFNGTGGEDSTGIAGAKTAAAATADGKWVYAAATDGSRHLVYYYRVQDETQGVSGSTSSGTDDSGVDPEYEAEAPGRVVGIAPSGTGHRVAVAATNADGQGAVRFFGSEGGETRTWPAAGNAPVGELHAIAASRDGNVVVAGGRAAPGNETVGGVFLLSPSQGLLYRYVLPNASFGDVVDVAVSDDGSHFAALTARGVLLSFAQAGRATTDPAAAPMPRANGTALAMSGDGRVLAAGGPQDLVVVERVNGKLTPVWNTTAPGRVNDLDADRTGRVFVAATDGGALAFSALSEGVHWTIQGKTTQAEVNANGTYVAFAQGKKVHARTLQEDLLFRFDNGEPLGSDGVPPESVAPFNTVTYDAFVRNEGARVSTYRLAVPSIQGATYEAEFTKPGCHVECDLAPGENGKVTIAVTPGRLSPRTYQYNLTAEVLGTGLKQNLTVPFTVLPETGIHVTIGGSRDRSIAQDGNDSILVGIQNQGNEATGIRIDVEQAPSEGSEWSVHFLGNSEFTVPSGASTSVRLRVAPPPRVENGTSNVVTITVTGGGGGAVTETVTYRVNPVTKVEVEAPARTKLVYPGEHQQFNVTAKNTGSVPAQFVAEWDALRDQTTGNGAWVVSVDLNPFRLEPGESRELPVRIFAPAGSEEGDHARFRITVRTVPLQPGDTTAEGHVNLTASVVYRKITEPNQNGDANTIPGPSLALLALAGLGTAWATGRRRL